MGMPMVLILLEILPLGILLLALLPMLVTTVATAVAAVWFPIPAIAVATVVAAVLTVQFPILPVVIRMEMDSIIKSCPTLFPTLFAMMWHLLDPHLLVLGDASLDLVALKLSPAVLPAPLPALSTTIETIVMIHRSIVTDMHLN